MSTPNIPGGQLPPGYVPSVIRTWVPVLVGSVLAWAAVHWHIVVDPGASATVGTVAAALCIAGYYALARVVERRWPRLGAVLLSAGLVQAKPIYAAPAVADALAVNGTVTIREPPVPGRHHAPDDD